MSAPIQEFNTNFKILLIGRMKILPKRNKKQIHAIYIIMVLVSNENHLVLFTIL